jgi:hypothetical protein
MKKLLSLALVLASISCGETTTTPPSQLNLDRPADMTFTCVGLVRIIPEERLDPVTPDPTDPIIQTAQPTSACDIRSGDHPTGTPVPVPPGQEDLTGAGGFPIGQSFWYGFILQPGPGTVAIAEFQTKPSTAFAGADVSVLDADPLTPGKNGISIGEDPIAIATDRTGCKVVTANAGSCDLSVLDVTSAVDFNPDTPIDVRRLEVTNRAGQPIRAKPAALVAEPSIDVHGRACADTASGVMYVAYPSCHMVAAVDGASGQIVGGVLYEAGGPRLITDADLDTLSCVDECAGGTAPPPGVRPVTIDLERDPRTLERRMVIGADNSSSVTLVELTEDTTLPESVAQIQLEDLEGTLGVTQVALTPQIGMGGEIHTINDDTASGGQFQFVYAVATDDTVRVADVLSLRKECDTQVDARYLRDINSVQQLSCMPVGDPATPPRRSYVRGPGIQLVGDALPISVDIIKSVPVEGDARLDEDPGKLIGYFAIIGASNGGVFIVNVDDDDRRDLFSNLRPLLTPMPLQIAHQLRDSVSDRGALATIELNNQTETLCDINGTEDVTGEIEGGPRALTPPARNIPVGTYAPEKVFQLPGFRNFTCTGVDATRAVSELSFTAPEAIRDFVFPDLAALRTEENWTLIWEGSLSRDLLTTAVDGPAIREAEMRIDGSGLHLIDSSKPFCNAGVERFDLVQVRGCDPQFGNADCPTGYECFVHPDSQLQGIGACLLDTEADRLAETCKDFLTSLRRYTIGATESGELQLLPRRHTLRTTPIEGCDTNEQCQDLADYALTHSVSQHPMFDTTPEDTHTWTCQADPLRGAVTTGKRCQMRCDATADCVTGTVCQGGLADGSKAGFCMEGVLPPQACINAPQRFELRAGEAFAVVGQRTGFDHAIIADANGQCVKDLDASPQRISRIPLTPAACDPTADPLTGRLPDGTFEPNPCALTTETTDVVPQYLPGTCDLNPDENTRLVPRQAQAIRYRNRGLNLTIVDPTYPGDAACILDRGGTLGNIPHVFTNYQLSFTQTAGLAAINIPVSAALPVRVLRGPTQSIWVVDQGDFLSTSISQPSTRGKVFRVEAHQLGLVNILE